MDLQNDLPTIAVVVPAFNSADWMEATLASVCSQDYPESKLSVVVVDDGSTDGSIEVADRFLFGKKAAYKLLSTNGRLGPSAARNLGWRAVESDWIQFLDADDLLASEKLKIQGRIANLVDKDVAVVYSDWQRLRQFEGDWRPFESVRKPQLGDDVTGDLLDSDNFIATGSQLYARSWLQRVGGWDERHRFIEDNDLALRLAFAGGRFVRAPTSAPLFWYRFRHDSLSQSDREHFCEGCLRNVRMAIEHWRVGGALSASRKQRVADVFLQASRYFRSTDSARADALLTELQGLAPGALPSGPPLLRRMSRLLGIVWAERAARVYRRIKSVGRPSALALKAAL